MGPMVDANSHKPIWKHEALDSDGICSPGLVFIVHLVVTDCIHKQVWVTQTLTFVAIFFLQLL